MPFFANSPRVSSITSRIPALMSKHSFRGGAFLMSPRIRSMMSPARSASPTIQPKASLTSPRSGGCLSKKFRAAQALLRRADRLFHFMGDRGRELTHGGDAVGVRQLHLHLAGGLGARFARSDRATKATP